MPIIDFRFRPPTEEIKANHRQFEAQMGLKGSDSWHQRSLEDCVREMEELDLVGVVMGRALPKPAISSDHLKELADRYPHRFIPIAGVDPSPSNRQACQEEIQYAVKDLGFRGIHFDHGLANPPLVPNDERLYPIYAQCNDLGAIVCLQIGPLSGGSIACSNPLALESVARDFPNLQLVMAHGGYPFVTEAVALMVRYPNVWISPDAYHFRPLGGHYVEAFSSPPLNERYLYGSAFPYGLHRIQGLNMKESYQRWRSLPWKDEDIEKLSFQNAARLLGYKR